MKTKRVIARALSVALLSLAGVSHAVEYSAGNLPPYYPESMPWRGELQAVDVGGGRLTINASDYAFNPNVQVHSLNTEHSSIRSLKTGMKVGYLYREHPATGKKVIFKIWVLPADMEVGL